MKISFLRLQLILLISLLLGGTVSYSQILVAGTSFEPTTPDATKTFYGVTEIQQYGLQAGNLTVNVPIVTSTEEDEFYSTSQYGVTDNYKNLDSARYTDMTGDEEYALVFSPNRAAANLNVLNYTVRGLEPGADYEVRINYESPTSDALSACTGTDMGFKAIVNTANADPVGQDVTKVSMAGEENETITVSSSDSNPIGDDGVLSFDINLLQDYYEPQLQCKSIAIKSIEVWSVPNPEIISADGEEVCAGEQITIQTNTAYNADFQWQVNDGSGWADISGQTNSSLLYEVLSVGEYQFRLEMESEDGDVVTSEELTVDAITCCSIDGFPASRKTVFYDDFGRVDLSDPTGSTYIVQNYSYILNTTEYTLTTTTPFRWELSPSPYPDLSNPATFQSTGPLVDGEYAVAGVITGYNPVTSGGVTYSGAQLQWASRVTGASTPTDPSYDHSGDLAGAALFINNPPNTGGETIYRRTIDNLCFGKTLFFECWIAVFTNSAGGAYNPVDVQVVLTDDDDPTNTSVASATATRQADGGGVWVKVSAQITLTGGANNSMTVDIINNQNTSENGNDLVLDDIKVTACAPPSLNAFFDLEDLSTEIEVCSDEMNIEVQTSQLLENFYGNDVQFLYQWSTTPEDISSWTNYGTPQAGSEYTIPDPSSDIAFDGLSEGDQVYFRVIAASPSIFSLNNNFTTVDANLNDPCRNYSISENLVATVGCPECNKPTSVTIANGDSVALCEGTGLILEGSYEDGGETAQNTMSFVWYQSGETPVSGDYTTLPITDQEFTSLVSDDGGEWVLRVEDGSSGNSSCYTEASVIVTVVDVPDAPTVEDVEVCVSTGTVSPSATAGTDLEIVWYSEDTPSDLGETTTTPEIDATTSSSTTYYAAQRTTGDAVCESETRTEVVIAVLENPILSATDPAAVCSPATVDITTVWSDASTLTSTTIEYTTSDGDAVSDATSVSEGTYEIKASENGCSDSVEVTVVVNALPTADLDGGGAICNDGSDTENLSIELTGAGPWSLSIDVPNSSNDSVITITSSPTSVAVMAEGSYTLSAVSDTNCSSGTVTGDPAVVTYHSEVVATPSLICNDQLTAAGISGVTLEDDEFLIVMNINQGDSSSINIEESTTFGVTFTETSAGSGIWYSNAVDEANTVTLDVTDGNDCNTFSTVPLNTQCSCPATGVSSIALDSICADGSTSIEVTSNGGAGNYNVTLIQPDSTLQLDSDVVGPTSTFTVTQEGSYSVAIESIDDACTVNGGSVNLAYFESPAAELSITNDVICEDGSDLAEIEISLTSGSSSADITINRTTGADTLIELTSSTASFTTNEVNFYGIESLTDANGCTALDADITSQVEVTSVAVATAEILEVDGDASFGSNSFYKEKLTNEDTVDVVANVIDSEYVGTWSIEFQGSLINENENEVSVAGLETAALLPDTTFGDDGITRLVWSVVDQNGICEPVYDTLKIVKVTRGILPDDFTDSICVDTEYSYDGLAPIAGLEVGYWIDVDNVLGGGANAQQPNGVNITVPASSAIPGTYSLTYVLENTEFSDNEEQTITLVIDEMPSTASSLADTIRTCDVSEELNAITPSPSSSYGVWTKISGTGEITTGQENTPTATLTDLVNGESGVFRWTVSNGQCIDRSFKDVVVEKAGELTSSTISYDGVEVTNSSDTIKFCETETPTISNAGFVVASESGIWSISSGSSVTITEDNSSSQVVTVSGTGTTLITWTVSDESGSGCNPNESTILLEVVGQPVADIISITPTEVCEGESVNLLIDDPGVFTESIAWTTGITSLVATSGASTNEYVLQSGLTDEFGTKTITLTTSNSVCGSVSDDISLDVNEVFNPQFEIVEQSTKCESDEVTYTLTNTQDLVGATYAWGYDGSGDFTVIDESTFTISNLGVTTSSNVSLEVASGYACNESDSIQNAEVQLTVVAPPAPLLVASGDVNICEIDGIDIEATNLSGGSYQWYKDGVALASQTGTSLTDINTSGQYYIQESDGGICDVVYSDTLTLSVDEQPVVNAGEDIVSFESDPVSLNGSISAGDTTWTTISAPVSFSVIDDVNNAQTSISTDSGGVYVFELTAVNGLCSASDEVIVNIQGDIKVPNVFTPNGDEIHDLFQINGLDTYTYAKVYIYTRWGNLIYESPGEHYDDAPWDGGTVAEGVYYYIIDVGDDAIKHSGVIHLIR